MKTVTLQRFQKAREQRVEAGGYVIIIRRPSPYEIEGARVRGESHGLDFACAFVAGWEDVLESDILPGGDPEPVGFDADVFRAWIKERPELWAPLIDGVVSAYNTWAEAREKKGNA